MKNTKNKGRAAGQTRSPLDTTAESEIRKTRMIVEGEQEKPVAAEKTGKTGEKTAQKERAATRARKAEESRERLRTLPHVVTKDTNT
ncbi:MAG: hypothetical protein K2L51_01335, partial [Clostridiales bacterium]|nr:hypothetical protein [Clostridiales bacterium]